LHVVDEEPANVDGAEQQEEEERQCQGQLDQALPPPGEPLRSPAHAGVEQSSDSPHSISTVADDLIVNGGMPRRDWVIASKSGADSQRASRGAAAGAGDRHAIGGEPVPHGMVDNGGLDRRRISRPQVADGSAFTDGIVEFGDQKDRAAEIDGG
jgi:hypothetical protein